MPGWQAQPQPQDGVPGVALQVPLHPPPPIHIDGCTIPLIPAKARTFPLC